MAAGWMSGRVMIRLGKSRRGWIVIATHKLAKLDFKVSQGVRWRKDAPLSRWALWDECATNLVGGSYWRDMRSRKGQRRALDRRMGGRGAQPSPGRPDGGVVGWGVGVDRGAAGGPITDPAGDPAQVVRTHILAGRPSRRDRGSNVSAAVQACGLPVQLRPGSGEVH
jgi:hypothetical protein